MPSFSKVVLLTRSAHWNILCVPGLRTSHQIYSTSRVDGTLGVLIFTWVETATSEDQVKIYIRVYYANNMLLSIFLRNLFSYI